MESEFEQLILDEGLICEEELEKIKKSQIENQKQLYKIIIEDGLLTKENLEKLLVERFGIELIDLEELCVEKAAVAIIPEEIAVKYCVFPFDMENNVLRVAMENPFDLSIIDSLRFISRMEVKPYLSDKDQIKSIIDKYYRRQNVEKALEDLRLQFSESLKLEDSGRLELDSVKDAPAVKIVDFILTSAVKSTASDIHIEPFENIVLVRLRIDGVLSNLFKFSSNIHAMICSRIKILSQMEISEKRIPQDGKFHYLIDENCYDFRVSSLPTMFGEKIVIRVLYKIADKADFNMLGISDKNQLVLKKVLLHTSGLFLITGPTGSGKTSTLYSMLNILNKDDKNIITVEEPVEYTIFGVNQVNVNAKTGLTFANGLRSILRQDPDIIMVGEIRDKETADIAVRAAITGHLVLATLHTKDAPGSILRLKDMGIPHYLLSDALIAVMAQRLVRKICPFCKRNYEPDLKMKNMIGAEGNYMLYKGEGCPKCNGKGYLGRIPIVELMYIDEQQRRMIEDDISIDEVRKYCLKNGMVSLKDDCIELVKKGVTSYEELVKVILSG